MRGLFFAAASLLAVGSVSAGPLESRQSTCMPENTGTALANAFKDLIHLPFNKTLAIHTFTTNYEDYSDSVNELINNGCPNGPKTLGDPTFDSRSAFITGQSGQPPIPFEILNIWHGCKSVTFRWRTSAPGTVSPEEVVTGIIVLSTVPNTFNSDNPQFSWKVETSYSEFNSGAWLYDLGVFKPTNCSS